MKNKRFFSALSFLLAFVMLVGCLPMGAIAFTGASSENYRGAMTEDENGVMIYDDLAKYLAKSVKDQVLLADYETQGSSATNSKVSVATVDTRYPDPVVDISVYYDKTIKGTTPVIRQGLTELDSVTYIDSATGEVTSGKAPVEMTASNGGDSTYNGGYGTNEKGETTTHYERKSVLFYIINHNCSERIGTEDDVSILSDYIAEGYLVVVLDYKNQASAVTPYLEMSLTAAYDLFISGGAMVADLKYDDGTSVSITNYGELYFLPEGCRLARDIWYYDPSIWGANGVMEKFVEVWNANIAGGVQDKHGIGKVASVEELIKKAKQKNYELPINYKYSMNITYPSQPKDGYKAPLYIQEGTNQVREQASNAQDYRHVTLMGFALNGYATALYDHSFYPFLMYFQYDATFGYGNHYDNYNNGRAAVRCARYYADALGYSAENIGIAGISKATIATAALATKNNKEIQCTISGYNTKVSFGDIFPEGTDAKAKTPDNRLKEIVQPFMYYDEACKNEVSSDLACAYVAAGSGVTNFFGTGQYTNREMIPMVVSDGVRDEYNSYDYYEQHEDYYESVVDVPFLMIPMLDQDHTYPVGYDDEYGYERLSALIRFFDSQLKPDANRAPEVIWITPANGSTDIPVSGEWTAGPYTIYGQALNGYEREQKIQVRFVEAVSPDSVGYGMVVRDASGKRIDGEWVASQNDTMFTFVTDGLKAGTTYTITATSGIVSKNGTPLAEEKSVTFTTEGSYALYAVADTYVSSLTPDKAYGDAEKLIVEGGSIALLSYPTASIASATKITLSTYGTPDVGTSVSIYALPNYKVAEDTLTYNILTASDAWASKVSLGTFSSFESEQIALDLSALAAVGELGDTVTIAIASNAAAVTNPYIYENDFEDYTIGSAMTGTDSTGATVTILAANGRITDGRNELDNRIYSDYIARLGGANPQYMDMVVEDGSQALRAYGICESVKFYNSFKDSAFTAEDVGKSYRVSFRAKAEKNGGLIVLVNSANKGEGGSDKFGTFTGPVSAYDGNSAAPQLKLGLKAGEWLDVSYFVTVTEEMVAAQAGLLSISFPWTTWHFYAWIDDVVVKECTPTMVIAAKESDSNLRLAMITENASAVEFAAGELEEDDVWVNQSIPSVTAVTPAMNAEEVGLLDKITLTFDKAMDMETFAEGIVVTNETTGKTVSGEWTALDEEGFAFAFSTSGFMANCTYSVKVTEDAKTLVGFGCMEEVITRFTTEGSSAVRPLVSTYVSSAEPAKHFGLDIDPSISSTNIGVLTYSAKALADASGATLYLPMSTAASASVELYAIADYKPDASFCYNTLSALSMTKIADAKATNGVLELDAKVLLSLGAEETVTLVFKPTFFTFEQNFNSYKINVGINNKDEFGNNRVRHDGMVLSSGQYGGASTYDENGYTTFLLDYTGNQPYAYVYKDEAIDASQILQWKTRNGQTIQFHGSMKRDYFTQADLGRSFNVTMRIYPTVKAGCTVGLGAYSGSTQTTPAGYTPERSKKYYDAGEATLTLNQWNDVSFNITVTQDMINYQAKLVGIFVNAGTSDAYTYLDDIKVTEVVPAITVDSTTAILVTAHDKLLTKPTVTTYVSSDAPTTHYGLHVAPKVDATNIGVLTYSAKALAGATDVVLQLPVSVASAGNLEIYAIADYTPNASFCYNTLAALSLNKIADATVTNGTVEIDAKALTELGATGTITIVIKAPAFTFAQNFDSYVLGTTYLTSDRKYAVLGADGAVGNGKAYDLANVNQGYSDYIYRNNAAYKAWIVSDPTLSDSQIFKAQNYGGKTTMFYSTLKNGLLTADDIGRTYNVSLKMYAPTSTLGVALQVCPAVGGSAQNSTTQKITKGAWNTLSYTVTITETMVTQQASMVSVFANTDTSVGDSYVYFDDIKVVEVVPTVTVGADAALVTEGAKVTVEVADSENPVKDMEIVLPAINAAQLAIGSDITIYYYATLLDDDALAQMRFTVAGKSETVDGVKSGDKYVFAYRGIAPQGMGETIEAELLANGEVVATLDDYSVLTYCKTLLGMSSSELGMSDAKYAAMKTAIADLLAYGAAAQKYTGKNLDALVDEGIAGISSFEALDNSFKRVPGTTTDANFGFTAAGVYFDYTNRLYFKFKAVGITEENFLLRVKNNVTSETKDYTLSDFESLGSDRYRVMTDPIFALDFGTEYTVTLIKVSGGVETVVQTLAYGISAYVYSMQNDADMGELAQRTYLYGVSARAYADAK